MTSFFAQPWFLVLLGTFPLLAILAVWDAYRKQRALRAFSRLASLEAALARRGWLPRIRGMMLTSGLFGVALGVAGPQWGRDWQQSAAPGRDLVVVVDCSRSMFAESPSRLERAKAALDDLALTLKKRGGHRVSLVVFAGRAERVCPLTHDYEYFRSAVADLSPKTLPPGIQPDAREVSGTRIGAGIYEAVKALDERYTIASDILLLSDGDDPARDGEWAYGVAEAKAVKVPVHCLGIGDPDGVTVLLDGVKVETRLYEEPLREIAAQTGGKYFPGHTKAVPLGDLYLQTVAGQPLREAGDDAVPASRQQYVWALLPGFVFLVGALALPERIRRSRGLR